MERGAYNATKQALNSLFMQLYKNTDTQQSQFAFKLPVPIMAK